MPNNRGRGGGGRRQDGSGQGRRAGAGAKGNCVCPSCVEKVEHQPGVHRVTQLNVLNAPA